MKREIKERNIEIAFLNGWEIVKEVLYYDTGKE